MFPRRRRHTSGIVDWRSRRLRIEVLEVRRMLATIVVNSTADVINALDGVTTLREAIIQANDNNNQATTVDSIQFANNVKNQTISVTSALPAISEPVDIQVDSIFPIDPDVVTITRNGSFAGSGLDFNIASGGSSQSLDLQGLKITNFADHGLLIRDLPDGTSFTAELNVIDGNGGSGVHIDLPTGTSVAAYTIRENVITNNLYGIRVIDVDSTFNISSNRIGTDGSSLADGNVSHGIYFSASLAPSTQASHIRFNTISGNGGDGIRLEDSFATNTLASIESNEIGFDVDQTFEIGNGGNGVTLLRSRMPVEFNEIGGNVGHGIVLDDSDLVEVRGNRIGRNLGQASMNFGNGGNGITLTGGSQQNVVRTNLIYYNAGDGIEVLQFSTIRNEISQNEFRANIGVPIDLRGVNGQDANDVDDSDTGGNEVINFPVHGNIASYSGTQWTIPFAYDVNLAGDYRFEFYRYDPASQLYTFVKSAVVNGVTAGASDFLGSVLFQSGSEFSEGDRLSVLAVRLQGSTSGNTSELSPISPPIYAPARISNVIVSSPTESHSFATASAAGNQYVPVSFAGANQLDIQFTKAVTFGQNGAELVLHTSNGNTVPIAQDGFSYNPNTLVATWTFDDSLPAGKYAIALDASTILDAASGELQLDGEWDTPISHTDVDSEPDNLGRPAQVLLSGSDGTAGGNFRFHFAVLPTGSMAVLAGTRHSGDYDDNDIVDDSDYVAWKSHFATTLPQPNGDWADGNNSGGVDAGDYTLWRDNLGSYSAWSGGPSGNASSVSGLDHGDKVRTPSVAADDRGTDGNFRSMDGLSYHDVDVVGFADSVNLTIRQGLGRARFTHLDLQSNETMAFGRLGKLLQTFRHSLLDVRVLADSNGGPMFDDSDLSVVTNLLSKRHYCDMDGDAELDNADLDLMFAQYGLALDVVS